MYNNVTDIFKTTIRSPSRTFKGRLKINGKWINAGLKKMSYETSSTSEEALQLGAAVSARIELTIKKIDELFENTEIPVEIGLKVPGGKYEYIPFGFFTAEHPKTETGSTTFTAYDRMMKTTGVFISELTYPANAAAVMNEISSECDVPCDTTGLDGITINSKPVGYTYREMIGYIASLAGKFASIDRNGMIVFKWYTDSGFTVNTSRLMSFEEDESDYHLDTLTCSVDNSTSMTAGSGTLGITFENPFMTQDRLNAIYNEIKDFSYRGISFKTLGDVRLDPWDIVTVNYNGTEYKVPVMNIVMEYDGGLSMTVTSYGKTETESSTDFQGPNAKASERTYAELMLAKEMIAKKVDAEWVKANTVTAEEIISVKADINTIKNNYLQTIEADIKYATVEEENVIKSDIEQLNVKYEKVAILDGDVADIKTFMFGSATGSSLTTEFSNSVVSMIGDAQIKSAMIDNIAANKITSGKIYTNLVEILSQSGNLDMSDNTILIKDDAEIARVQIGKDASGDYNMYVWDKSGNLMFDALGLTESGITRQIIWDDVVKDDANISASKLNIDSLFSVINEDGSHTLKSSKIYVDADKQTLDISFKNMTTSITSVTSTATSALDKANTNATNIATVTEIVNTQGTQISLIQGQISSKIWQSDITTAVNNVQIGGRNLYYLYDIDIRQLHCVDSYSVNDGEITLVANGNDLYIGEALHAGDKWRPICGALMDIEGASYVTINISNSLFNKNYYNFLDADKKALSIYTYWNISSGRITVPSGAKYLNLRVGYGAAVSGTAYKLRIKVEKGNKATDWSPAPEDVDSSITTLSDKYTDVKQTVDGISATVASHTTQIANKADSSTVTNVSNKVTSLEQNLTGFKTTVSDTYATKTALNTVDGKFANYSTTTQMNNAITQAITAESNSIKSEISKSYVTNSVLSDSLSGVNDSIGVLEENLSDTNRKFYDYSTTEQMNNAITQAITTESNSIRLEVSGTYTTKTEFNELQIGGRNLIRAYYIQHFDNGTTDTSEYITSGKVVCQGNGVNTGFRFDSINCYEPSTQYVLSGYITVTSKSCNNIYVFNGKQHSFISFKIDGIAYSNPFDIARTDVVNILNDGKPHFFELRYETNANMPADVDVSYTYIQLNKSNTTQINYEFKFFKLEKGTKATDWSPAPEDVEAKFNNYATTASLEVYIKKDPTSGELKSAIEAIADNINLTASGSINISGNKSVNIYGNLFTLNTSNATITADGTITCKNLSATNATLTGSLKTNTATVTGADGKTYSMQGTFQGGELKIANLTNGSNFAIQGHGMFATNSLGITTLKLISDSSTGEYDGLIITGQAGTEVEVLRDGIALWYQPNNQKYTKIGKGYARICSSGTQYYPDCALSVIGGIKTDALNIFDSSIGGWCGAALNRTPENDISFSWDGENLRIHIDNTIIATYEWGSGSWI